MKGVVPLTADDLRIERPGKTAIPSQRHFIFSSVRCRLSCSCREERFKESFVPGSLQELALGCISGTDDFAVDGIESCWKDCVDDSDNWDADIMMFF